MSGTIYHVTFPAKSALSCRHRSRAADRAPSVDRRRCVDTGGGWPDGVHRNDEVKEGICTCPEHLLPSPSPIRSESIAGPFFRRQLAKNQVAYSVRALDESRLCRVRNNANCKD